MGRLNPTLFFQISFLQLLPPGTGDIPVLAISIFISIPEESGEGWGDEMSQCYQSNIEVSCWEWTGVWEGVG